MDKSHAQSAISKSKPVSSSSEIEDDCEIHVKCKKNQKLYNPWISRNLKNGISRKSYTSLIDNFTSRFDKESMQLFHLASQFIKNPAT